jgi:hypothetical protein
MVMKEMQPSRLNSGYDSIPGISNENGIKAVADIILTLLLVCLLESEN